MNKSIKKVFLVMLATIFVFSFTGCSTQSPQDTLSTALDALKAGDDSYFNDAFLDVEEELDGLSTTQIDEVAKVVFSTMDYEIISSTEEGESVDVKVKITNKDYSKAMESYFTQAMEYVFSNQNASDEEINSKMIEILLSCVQETSKSDTNVENEVTFSLTKTDDGYKINEPSDEAMHALFGNMFKALEDFN